MEVEIETGQKWQNRQTGEVVTVGSMNKHNVGIGEGRAYPRDLFLNHFTLLPTNRWHIVRDQAPSDVTNDLVTQVLDRDEHGRAKYGKTLDRDDLTLAEWLQHMAEELMDGAGYALAAKRNVGVMTPNEVRLQLSLALQDVARGRINPYSKPGHDKVTMTLYQMQADVYTEGFAAALEALKQSLDNRLPK